MENVAKGGVYIARDHEAESYLGRTGEQIDRYEIQRHDDYSVRYRFCDRPTASNGSCHGAPVNFYLTNEY